MLCVCVCVCSCGGCLKVTWHNTGSLLWLDKLCLQRFYTSGYKIEGRVVCSAAVMYKFYSFSLHVATSLRNTTQHNSLQHNSSAHSTRQQRRLKGLFLRAFGIAWGQCVSLSPRRRFNSCFPLVFGRMLRSVEPLKGHQHQSVSSQSRIWETGLTFRNFLCRHENESLWSSLEVSGSEGIHTLFFFFYFFSSILKSLLRAGNLLMCICGRPTCFCCCREIASVLSYWRAENFTSIMKLLQLWCLQVKLLDYSHRFRGFARQVLMKDSSNVDCINALKKNDFKKTRLSSCTFGFFFKH